MQERYFDLSWTVLEDIIKGNAQATLLKYCDPPFPEDAIITRIEVDNESSHNLKIFVRSKEYINVFIPMRIDIVCYRRREDWLKQPRVQKFLKDKKEKSKIKVTMY